jgi:hypothetical protein
MPNGITERHPHPRKHERTERINEARTGVARREAERSRNAVIVSLGFIRSDAWVRLRYDFMRDRDGRCQCCGRGAADGVKVNVDQIHPRRTHPQLALCYANLQVCAAHATATALPQTGDDHDASRSGGAGMSCVPKSDATARRVAWPVLGLFAVSGLPDDPAVRRSPGAPPPNGAQRQRATTRRG